MRVKGPQAPLVAGKWSQVRIVFDQSEFYVEVDGQKGKPAKASAYQLNARYTALGAANHHPCFFRGALSDLSFRVR